MNKNLLSLLAVAACGVAITACNSGTSTSATPPQVTSQYIAAPTGASQAGSSAGYYESNGCLYTIYSAQGGSTYVAESPVELPSAPTYVGFNNGYTQLTTGESGAPQFTAYVYDALESASFANITPTIVASNQFTFVKGNNTLYTGDATGLEFNTLSSNGDSPQPINLNNCPGVTGNSVTALSTANVTGTDYLGIGDATGDICLYNIESRTWLNITASAVNHGYTPPSQVNGVSFSPINTSNQAGYWFTANGDIYQVVAPVGATTCNTATCALNKLNSSPFSGYPTGTLTAIISDANNNLFVGTAAGQVYSLASGQTQWTNVQLTTTDGNADTNVTSLVVGVSGNIVATTQAGNAYNIGF